MIGRLFKRLLYGGSSSLRAFEASCLTCLRNSLPPEGREILDSQIRAIELIQRFSDDKLVTFHLTRNAAQLFPNRAPELYVARLVIPRKPEKSLTCEFVFHEGRISSIEFGRSPRGIDPNAVTCTKIEVLEDLMASPPRVGGGSPATRGPMLATIGQHATLGDVIGPASLEKRELLLERLATFAPPDDYSELLAETDGFLADGWRFWGTRARKIVLSDRTYFVAAETTDGQSALCFRDGEQIPRVIFYDEADDREEAAGDRFVDALIRALRERD